jgi:hypothetical protein
MENSRGVVKGLIFGIGALIIVTIVTLVVVSTMINSNLLRSADTTTTVSNEVGWINTTTYALAEFDSLNRNYAISSILNGTGGPVINAANYTFNSATGVLSNKTTIFWDDAYITYTFIHESNYESSVDRLGGNLTGGIDNVSGKIPTMLLLGAVVLLFGVVLLLVRYSQSMGFMGQGGGSL